MNALKHCHPAVGFCFCLLMIALSLVSLHPAFLIKSFVAALGYVLTLSGLRAFLRANWWLAVLIVVVTLFNGVFSAQGLTVLLTLNAGFIQTPITLESLVYGLCMGLMLAGVILWFVVLSKLCSTQGVIELFSKLSPTTGMMIARLTVFVPELLAQARLVSKVRKPLVSSARQSRKERLAFAGVMSSYLLEWGMEKSLITAQSMTARGYGSRKRTSMRRTRLTPRDVVPLTAMLALGAASLGCILWEGAAYQFYPYLSPLTLWWGYLPFLALTLIPLLLQLEEEVAWRRTK
ncbi:MAG: energy-coupling factor transporter transmembrane protein EcfT [Coriobacteriia bacterium]|nr:energy-coupling factor transporter transmembrane protein EcfT [Coriobacteriia bacterium]